MSRYAAWGRLRSRDLPGAHPQISPRSSGNMANYGPLALRLRVLKFRVEDHQTFWTMIKRQSTSQMIVRTKPVSFIPFLAAGRSLCVSTVSSASGACTLPLLCVFPLLAGFLFADGFAVCLLVVFVAMIES